ncbi:MAG: hypothetical protein ACRERU_09555 [Methylococcales bacterium]
MATQNPRCRSSFLPLWKDGRWVYHRLGHERFASGPVLEWLQREFAKDMELQHDRERLAEITAIEPEKLCRRQRGERCCPRTPTETE